MDVRMGAFRIHHNNEELMVSQHLGRDGRGEGARQSSATETVSSSPSCPLLCPQPL